MIKHGRTSASGSGDPYGSYKRALQNDVVLKDNGLNSDLIRPPKTKVVKSKSDGGVADFHKPRKLVYPAQQVGSSTYARLPKRSKATKKDKGEKLSVSKLPRSDGRAAGSRPLLGRRSRTFIVESHQRLLSNHGDAVAPPQALVLHPHPHPHASPHLQRSTTDGSRDEPSPAAAGRLQQQDNGGCGEKSDRSPVSKVKSQFAGGEDAPGKPAAHPKELKSEESAGRWYSEVGRGRAGGGGRGGEARVARSLRETEQESLREGARNPLSDSNGCLPVRPKSAGQLRYYDSDDSDESSLDGEIEIVDIDKELENDPEPSPYWNSHQGPPPMQVPEVFVQAATITTTSSSTTTTAGNSSNSASIASSPSWKDNTAAHNRSSRFSSQPPLESSHRHHQLVHHHQPQPTSHAASTKHEPASSSSSHSSLSSFAQHPQQLQQQHQQYPVPQPPPSRPSRHRHDSGESSVSAFSDIAAKPAELLPPSNGRRRIMSEPEITGIVEERNNRLVQRKARKSGQRLLLREESNFRGHADLVGPPSPSAVAAAARASRERLYSDTMERVLSRYSEMGLHDDAAVGGGSRKGKPSRIPVGSSGVTSASRGFSSSTASGHVIPPPRKLKPILKQPRYYDTNDVSE